MQGQESDWHYQPENPSPTPPEPIEKKKRKEKKYKTNIKRVAQANKKTLYFFVRKMNKNIK